MAKLPADSLAKQGANAILGAFEIYQTEFKRITARAKIRFEKQDWPGGQKDAVERLDLYPRVIGSIVGDVKSILGQQVNDGSIWAQMKLIYAGLISGRDDFELAETFFNSVTRRIFATVGVDTHIEFVDSEFEPSVEITAKPIYRTYTSWSSTADLVEMILDDYIYSVPYANVDRDARLAAQEIDGYLRSRWGERSIDAVHLLRPVFYRGKGAYLVGRIICGSEINPLLLTLRHNPDGLGLDAVLLTEDEISIVFSFARSYFHVEVDIPNQLIHFLKSIMPLKRIAEIYISIGYNKHGKTELYRDLIHHLEISDDRFQIARGERGMVMVVFTLPSYDVVFKIIRDRFLEPKTTTRQEVMERYQLVFKHDRAGRLVDAQEFEHLKFERKRFSEDLLAELLTAAGNSVTAEAESIVIKHLYIERRTTPLNLYIQEAGEEDIREAVTDYGQAIKDLAATNIFPGDILLKNFGVTRHGRVVFYDYDELTLLTKCRFRKIPQARSFSDDFEAEPWFYVGKNDIFPEEFETFLGLPKPYREVFTNAHGDLFGVKFWRSMQKRQQSGEVVDIFPYKQSKRLCQSGA